MLPIALCFFPSLSLSLSLSLSRLTAAVMSVPPSTSSCVNIQMYDLKVPNKPVLGALTMAMKDYSILLRDRISAAEWQEDTTQLEQLFLNDAELQRVTAEMQKELNTQKKCLPVAFLCVCFICCLIPVFRHNMARFAKVQCELKARQTTLLEAFIAQLNAKYADRAVLIKARSDKKLTGVSVHGGRHVSSTNTYQLAQWLAIEMAEVEPAEKASIRDRVAQQAEAATARAAAGVVMAMPIPAVNGAGYSVQVQPMPNPAGAAGQAFQI